MADQFSLKRKRHEDTPELKLPGKLVRQIFHSTSRDITTYFIKLKASCTPGSEKIRQKGKDV